MRQAHQQWVHLRQHEFRGASKPLTGPGPRHSHECVGRVLERFLPSSFWAVSRRSQISVNLVVPNDIRRLRSELEAALFRVVQESLTNVRRHSGSETASIRLEKKPEEIVLEISDHGKGMTRSKEVMSGDCLPELGVGIPGMRQRLRQLGGRLEIESGSDGTKVRAIVPLAITDGPAKSL